jgi:hypothetical protein
VFTGHNTDPGGNTLFEYGSAPSAAPSLEVRRATELHEIETLLRRITEMLSEISVKLERVSGTH